MAAADDAAAAAAAAAALLDDDEAGFTLVEAMEDHMASYDEALYYACKEYERIHSLYYKQLKRSQPMQDVPLRYKLLSVWVRPLATVGGQCYFGFQCLLVIISLTQLVLETIPQYSSDVHPNLFWTWNAIEFPTCAFFLLDLVAHFILLPSVPNDFSRYSRSSYLRKVECWIDILSISPTVLSLISLWLPVVPQFDFLKALRILRFTKVMRQFHAVDQLAFTLEKSWKPLFGPFIFLFGVIVTISGMVYYLERGEYDPVTRTYRIASSDCLLSAPNTLNPQFECPKVMSKFTSLPQTLWFCLVTISTVGYGDMVPQTNLGRIFATVCILCGNVLTAMPIAIVGSYFTDIVATNRRRLTGDATRAFGRKSTSASRRADGITKNIKGTRGVDLTCGERLLDLLSQHSGGEVDLLDPAGVFVHQVNAFLKQEFDALVTTLKRPDGVAQIRQRRDAAVTDLELHFATSPSTALIPAVLPLTKTMPFTCGMLPGSVRYRSDALPVRGLPSMLFAAQLAMQAPHSLSVLPLYPAVITVNGLPISFDTPARLLVGDTVAVHAHAKAAPTAQYVYLKEDVAGVAVDTTAAAQDFQAAGSGATKSRAASKFSTATTGSSSSGVVMGGGGHITLRSVEAPLEHRGVTFAHYNPRNQDRLYRDL